MSAQQEMNPLALLGGVFDPLHQGHVAVAEAALELPGVEEVRWIPCKEPPHEKDSTHAPAEVRLAMAQLFCQEVEQFTCDDIEFERDGPSWTIDTVRALAEQYPGRPLLWLIGSDNVRLIGRWKEAEELWNLAIPVVAHRPGSGTVLRREHLPFLEGERWRLINSWSLPEVSQDISSTRLRSLLAAGKDVGDSIPLAVLEALESGGWYQQPAP